MITLVRNVHPIIRIVAAAAAAAVVVVVVVRIKRWLYKELSDRFHSMAAVPPYGCYPWTGWATRPLCMRL
jgi:hypothetical protein